MPTTLGSIRAQARVKLKEVSARYWTDAELLDDIAHGVSDLWGAIIDLNQEHFLVIDTASVSLASGASELTGVPANTFRVEIIEPSNTTSSGVNRSLRFVPRDYKSDEFIAARAMDGLDPTNGGVLYYCLKGAGSPVGAPTVVIAPTLSSTLTGIRFAYTPGPGDLTANSVNPIPGESDLALVAWTIAYARSKEREDRAPDPNWLIIYGTEKQNLLTRLTPRQTQEPEIVPGMFEGEW